MSVKVSKELLADSAFDLDSWLRGEFAKRYWRGVSAAITNGTSTVTVVMSIYDTAFAQFDVGLASAMSVVLVIVVGLITFVQFRVLREEGS